MPTGDHRAEAGDEMTDVFPRARYVILASRLVPGLDGGFTVATLGRARHLARAGVEDGRGPLLLTVDPGTTSDHRAQREAFLAAGAVDTVDVFRNLFDELRHDPSWLYDVAAPGGRDDGTDSIGVFDDAGERIATIPVVASHEWYLTDAPVVVHGAEGDRHVRGFRGLYHAWLDHVVAQLVEESPDRSVVVVCESRQLGVLIADWANPRARIVHTIHTCHLEPPYTPDAPLGALWQRWFDHLSDFDAVLWPTRQQQHDVQERFSSTTLHAVVPNAAPKVEVVPDADIRSRAVVLARLVPVKRLDHAIRAWSRVIQSVPGARLDIYGDGPLRVHLQREIDDLGLSEHVTLRGLSSESPGIFDGAALTLQTSAYEGQGLAPLEAMSRGCPVVTYDVRYGPRDRAVIGGEVLVEDGDVEALAAAAVRLLEEPAWRATASRGAAECARAFSASRTMAVMAAAVRDVLAAPARRGAPVDIASPLSSAARGIASGGRAVGGTAAGGTAAGGTGE